MKLNFASIALKTTVTMFALQVLSSFAQTVIATVNTIVGADLARNAALSGLPGAMIQVGAAIGALLLGMTMDRFGRRMSLAFGTAVGVAGAWISAAAIQQGALIWFLTGLVLIGFTRATSQMGRFVAAEVTPPQTRGRYISYVIVGGTFGSVIGPYLVAPSNTWAEAAQLNPFVGSYAVSLVIFAISALGLFLFLRPEPRDVAREVATLYPETSSYTGPTRPLGTILRHPTAFVAISAMVFSQVVMISLMGITTLHMHDTEHVIADISAVFSAHTFGMFAFSIFTGQLLDRWGRGPVILAGAGMLFVACAMAPIWNDVLPIGVALFLLGLGWNFCYIGGTTMLADMLTPGERARTQGANELMISLTTALASVISGVVFAFGGYTLAGLIGAAVSIIPFAMTGWWMMRSQVPSPAA